MKLIDMEISKSKEVSLAPIVLFTYNRLFETRKTIEALQKNHLANDSELFIFSDGSKNESNAKKVEEVREYLKSIDGFKNIKIKEFETNKGLANSIIDGVTEIINIYGKVIVLEDDLISSPNFLDFMNQALDYYKNSTEIISISGYTLPLKSLKSFESDYYFGYRASSWGWGCWKDRWDVIDWKVEGYDQFMIDKSKKETFKRGGSDMVKMLYNWKNGLNDSWAIRFCFHQFINDTKTVFPSISKIQSIGYSKEATNTVNTKRFITELDKTSNRKFVFNEFVQMDVSLVNDFKSRFSIQARIIDKVKRIFG